MRIKNTLRDLLLRQPETFAINSTSCEYKGEKYTYKAVTKKEILSTIARVRQLLKA